MNVPSSRPLQPRSVTAALVAKHRILDPVVLVGDRGYYLDSIGEPGKNDRGEYDDAMFLITPTLYACFNANTDPSRFQDGVANLALGLWTFEMNIHGKSKPVELQYKCLQQADPVTVHRDGGVTESGMFAIQIHRGSYNSTSSLGCQTIFPPQWDAFIALVESELHRYGQKTIPYLLCEYQGGKALV